MTYSNGIFSPHPLANPFNTRLGPSNVSLNPLHNEGAVKPTINTRDLQVPNQDVPMYGTEEWNLRYRRSKDLQVPNQDVPAGDQTGKQGFIRNSSAFRCHDGTVVDFKTGKVLYAPNNPNSEYCGKPNATINVGNAMSWNDDTSPKLDLLINNIDQYYGRANPSCSLELMQLQIDPESARYWIKAQEEASLLQDLMTDYLKKLIAQFEHHFPKSRLIEESKKVENGTLYSLK